MTTLEIRALLGDRKAQIECTEKGVLLICPHCGSRFIHWFANKTTPTLGGYSCTDCNHGQEKIYPEHARKKAILDWNTRIAPPIREYRERK